MDVVLAAINSSAFIVVGVMVLMVVAVGYGFFTREGSNIHHHGGAKDQSAPGLQGPEGGGSGMADGEQSSFETHGGK